MKNVIGSPARGESFFPRKREIAKVMDRIQAGNNLQIAAPRRVGKTSILFYLFDEKIEGYTYVYADSESIENEQEFYKKILKEILKADNVVKSKRLATLLKAGGRFLSKIKSISIFGTEIGFNEEAADINYFEELSNFLSGFELEGNSKLILLLDEFPQTILNIVEANNGDTKAAIQFLQSNRALRQNPDINGKVQFIYTGSIGLNHTVSAINASAFVNDLNSIEVEPLTPEEAEKFIKELLVVKHISISREAISHLLHKVEWLIPFHIQLAIQEIIDLAHATKMADISTVDKAFEKIIASRNNNHFEHYSSRLKKQFKGEQFKFVNEALQKLAAAGTIDRSQLFDMAIGLGLEESYLKIIEILIYDGYINNSGDRTIYRFNSPIVRMWWQQFNC